MVEFKTFIYFLDSKGKEFKKKIKFDEQDLVFAKFKALISNKLALNSSPFDIHYIDPKEGTPTVLSEDDDISEILDWKLLIVLTCSTINVVFLNASVEKHYQIDIDKEELNYSSFITKIANVIGGEPLEMDFLYFDFATSIEYELHPKLNFAEIVSKKVDFRVKKKSVNSSTTSNFQVKSEVPVDTVPDIIRLPSPAAEKIIPNWQCYYKFREHHFFISYRAWCEGLVAKDLAFYLSKETIISEMHPLHPFLNTECLMVGDEFGPAYLTALNYSEFIVLLISHKALEGLMKDGEIEDDMLLEVGS
ncbi:hypothetical protein HK096_001223 [Nowakowskiella sp. JEL0078]|nr:hypothetical protein HK096_001223 [Nowakowskiella sp. JEL0078]